MWFVLKALRRPVSILVAVIAIVLSAGLAIRSAPVDIFPDLGVPVIYVVQPYGGMSPAQMEGQIVGYYEYHFLYIAGIEHIESNSIQGMAMLKIYFHPGTDIAQSMAQVTAMAFRATSFMPSGTLPPFIVRFDVGSVPVGQLFFERDTQRRRSAGPCALQGAAAARHAARRLRAAAHRGQGAHGGGLRRPGAAALVRPVHRRGRHRAGEREPHAAGGQRAAQRRHHHRQHTTPWSRR